MAHLAGLVKHLAGLVKKPCRIGDLMIDLKEDLGRFCGVVLFFCCNRLMTNNF